MEYSRIEGTDVFGAPFDFFGGPGDGMLLESAEKKVSDFADMQTRAQGMGLALVWLEDRDHTFSALDALAVGMADVDGDSEITEDEEEGYNDMLSAVGAALVSLGASADNVKTFVDDEDDAAGKKLGKYLSKKMDGVESDDDDLVAGFAVSNDFILEAAYRRVKTAVNGKIVFKKKRLRPKRLSAKQRAALKKARRKANNGAARKKRAKAMRLRKSRGL